jgi:hypothetical protein
MPPIRQNVSGIRYYTDPDYIQSPSVTSIISKMLPKTGLKEWQAKTPDHRQYSRTEAILGSLKHQRILQQYADENLELPDVPGVEWMSEDRLDQLEIAECMWEGIGIEVGWPRHIERTLYRTSHPRCAGTFDMLAQLHAPERWGDGLTLSDIKSSKTPQEGHKYQIGAYFSLLPPALRDTTERGVIIYLHTQVKNNPTLQPTIIEMSRSEMERYGEKFLVLAEKFWELMR